MKSRFLSAVMFLVVPFVVSCYTIQIIYRFEYRYFGTASPQSSWFEKIKDWQSRERDTANIGEIDIPSFVSDVAAQANGVAPPPAQDLRSKYSQFLSQRHPENKLQILRNLAEWIQQISKDHYIPDQKDTDHWATFKETLQNNGDDCDGLELLVLYALLSSGFPEYEVYRALITRRWDGQNHMVTFWFEDRTDPWVIDPTGAATTEVVRMSQIIGWEPLRIFNKTEVYIVRRQNNH